MRALRESSWSAASPLLVSVLTVQVSLNFFNTLMLLFVHHVFVNSLTPSRDNDGDHTIRSTIAKNPMLHANFMALCFIESELLRNFDLFRPVTLTLSG